VLASIVQPGPWAGAGRYINILGYVSCIVERVSVETDCSFFRTCEGFGH